MIVISDTTPLRYLIEIEEVHVLEKLFGQVIIPEKVLDELQGKKTPERVKAWIQSRPAWLEVRKADVSLFTPAIKIQDGEREAISLAIELKANILLLDDDDALKEARRLKLTTARLFAILERASEESLSSLPKAIEKMRRTSFHMPPAKLIKEILERDQKRKEAEKQARKKTGKQKQTRGRKF